MSNNKIMVDWKSIHRWHEANLIGFAGTVGLFRARLGGRTMFVGFAAERTSSLGARLGAYRAPNGAWQDHKAGHLIHERRAEIDMQIALLDVSAHEIRFIADQIIDAQRPEWNMADVYRSRRASAKRQRR